MTTRPSKPTVVKSGAHATAHATPKVEPEKPKAKEKRKVDILEALTHIGKVHSNLAKAGDGRMIKVEERDGELKYWWVTPTPIRELDADEIKAIEDMA